MALRLTERFGRRSAQYRFRGVFATRVKLASLSLAAIEAGRVEVSAGTHLAP